MPLRLPSFSAFRLSRRTGTVLLLAAAAVTAGWTARPRRPHGSAGTAVQRMGELCTVEGALFTGSGNCVNCHAPDPAGHALVDENGLSVSPVWDWQATLMANSARDPFWRAKVAHEGLVNPAHRDEIEHTCTACHAPQGYHEALFADPAAHYTMADLLGDPLGLDGVGCTGCHAIDNVGLAGRSNGDLPINTEGVAWGGFENPWDGLMSGQTGFIPAYGSHMRTSEVCTSCHSLYSHTQDLTGAETGQVFFEQATYLEWVNSAYNAENVQCQTCHMPLVAGGAIAATQPNWLFPQRFGRHHFVGGNAFMLKLMRDNAVALDLSASPAQFDTTIARTVRSLTTETAELRLVQLPAATGEVAFEVEVINKVGHKFPSGYPSRLAFLEFTVRDADGDELFRSGGWADDEVVGRDPAPAVEPHHDLITSPDQVMIYEFAFADVSGAPSTVLERASTVLKDNRLPPRGFSTLHAAYDTVAVGPGAAEDPNFNRSLAGHEGTGSDRVTYRVPVGSYRGAVTAEVALHYVAVPARWVEAMFSYASASPDIAAFQSMYEAADRSPVEIARTAAAGFTDYSGVGATWRIAPNPATPASPMRLLPGSSERILEVWVFDPTGRMLFPVRPEDALSGFTLDGLPAGVYTFKVRTSGGWRAVKGVWGG
jgi:hypothetical protein